jgi:hypothetical protein
VELKQLKPLSLGRGIGAKQGESKTAPSSNHRTVPGRIDMATTRKARFSMFLTVAAAFGCSLSLFSGTVAVLDYSAQSATEATTRA